MKSNHKILLPFCLAVLAIGCGSWVGNPADSDGDDPEEELVSVPTISFTLPTPSVTSLTANPDDLLTGWVERINDNVDKLNEEIEKMNKDFEFTEPVTVTGKGPDGNETGKFRELEDDDLYDYEVVICVSDKVANIIKWSKDGKNILSERDLNQKPDNPEDLKVRTVYAEDSDKKLTIHFTGEPAGVPDDVDGTLLTSWDEAIQSSTDAFTVRGVRDWYNEGDVISADDYLTGEMDSSGDGEFVGWTTSADNTCGDYPTFSEDDPADLWCNSKEIGTDDWYSIDEAAEAWTDRLSSIGVGSESELGEIEFSRTCDD
jgi:hypothetical protein